VGRPEPCSRADGRGVRRRQPAKSLGGHGRCALARAIGGPLLLGTRASAASYPPRGTTAFLIGDGREFSRTAARRLRDQGYVVKRLAASTPAATAVAVAAVITDRTQRRGLPVVLAPRQGPGDALTAGALAGRLRGAVLLTDGDRMPSVTRHFLRQRRGPVYALGRAAAKAAPQLPQERRIVAATAARTALRVARTFFPRPRSITVSSLSQPVEALIAAGHAGASRRPLVLVHRTGIPAAVRRYLRDNADNVNSSVLIGGRPAVSEPTFDKLERLLTPERD
jgi:hypothetical protein